MIDLGYREKRLSLFDLCRNFDKCQNRECNHMPMIERPEVLYTTVWGYFPDAERDQVYTA